MCAVNVVHLLIIPETVCPSPRSCLSITHLPASLLYGTFHVHVVSQLRPSPEDLFSLHFASTKQRGTMGLRSLPAISLEGPKSSGSSSHPHLFERHTVSYAQNHRLGFERHFTYCAHPVWGARLAWYTRVFVVLVYTQPFIQDASYCHHMRIRHVAAEKKSSPWLLWAGDILTSNLHNWDVSKKLFPRSDHVLEV